MADFIGSITRGLEFPVAQSEHVCGHDVPSLAKSGGPLQDLPLLPQPTNLAPERREPITLGRRQLARAPPPASTTACFTQFITALAVTPSSWAPTVGVLPGCWHSRMTSAFVLRSELTTLLGRLLDMISGRTLSSSVRSERSSGFSRDRYRTIGDPFRCGVASAAAYDIFDLNRIVAGCGCQRLRLRCAFIGSESERGHMRNRSKLYVGAVFLVAVGVVLHLVGQARAAWAGYLWPGGNFTYRINATSFQNVSGLPLTAPQALYWVPHALNTWKERTGVGDNLTFTYAGTSAAQNVACMNGDTFNQVYVVNACVPGEPLGNCTTWAITQPWTVPGSPSQLAETDICVYGAAVGANSGNCSTGSYRLAMPMGPNDKDLFGLLTHEFGHALGLAHVDNTVMDAAALRCGNPLARFQYGEDVSSIRLVYGVDATRQRQWRESTAVNTWGPIDTAIPGTAYTHTHAGVGRRGSGERVIATRIGQDGNSIHFTGATYPIHSGSSWTNLSYSGTNTWRPPDVAGRPASYSGSELWVSAWAPKLDRATDCIRLRAGSSTDGFSTINDTPLNEHCGSIHEPSITFDKASGRFIMLYTRHKLPSDTISTMERIYAKTSTDGITWTSAQATGLYSIDTPDMACGPTGGTCMLTYLEGSSNDPYLTNFAVTVASNGTLSFGASTVEPLAAEWTPSAGVRNNQGFFDWIISAPVANCTRHLSCDLLAARSVTRPFAIPITWSPVTSSQFRGTLASIPESNRIYLWHAF